LSRSFTNKIYTPSANFPYTAIAKRQSSDARPHAREVNLPVIHLAERREGDEKNAMKNKHLVLLFLLVVYAVYLYNHHRNKTVNDTPDAKLAAEFLEKYKATSQITLDDGTEPNIQLLAAENGWSVTFGSLRAPADEDSIKAFMRQIQSAQVCAIPTTTAHATVTMQCGLETFTLKKHQGDTLHLTKTGDATSVGLISKASRWFRKPYENWIFRRLQVKKPQEINSLSFEFKDFPAVTLTKTDSLWSSSKGTKLDQNFMRDSMLIALTQLNQLEPALYFDPVSEAMQPFATLYINDGRSGHLKCYRRTEKIAEYYLQSSINPQVSYHLPSKTANQIFVAALLK
jgi:hypothetical protein